MATDIAIHHTGFIRQNIEKI